MDLVDYSEDVFDKIVDDYNTFSDKLSAESIIFIPISALKGDNVIERSSNMPWYTGYPLLDYLETVNVSGGRNLIDFRLPVQYVNWGGKNFRGYCGTIASGVIRKGEKVRVLPSGRTSEVQRIVTYEGDLEYAHAPMAVTLCLSDEIDVSRGDVIARENNLPAIAGSIEANLVWMDIEPMQMERDYLIKHTTRTVRGSFTEVRYRIDPEDVHRKPAKNLSLNEIGKVKLELKSPLFVDIYSKNRPMGSFVVIDPYTNQTVAAGMISKYKQVSPAKACESVTAKVIRYPADKKEEAKAHYNRLSMQGAHCIYVDDDLLREGLCKGIVAGSERYYQMITDLCNIVVKSGVSVVLSSTIEDKRDSDI
jgi:sulfate adenylyltransferase subunit 1 (EFTu-like GTPase family)